MSQLVESWLVTFTFESISEFERVYENAFSLQDLNNWYISYGYQFWPKYVLVTPSKPVAMFEFSKVMAKLLF